MRHSGRFCLLMVEGDKADLVLVELDLELIPGLKTHLIRVEPANQKVAVELDTGNEAGLASPASIPVRGLSEVNPLGMEQRLVKGCEVQTLYTVLPDGVIAGCTSQLRLRSVSHLLNQGQKIGTGERSGGSGSNGGGNSHGFSGLGGSPPWTLSV